MNEQAFISPMKDPPMPHDPDQIWMQVHHRLRDFIVRRVSSSTEADDILQEVFLRMHRGLSGLKDQRRILSWIFQITRHAIADYFRVPSRRREIAVGLAQDLETSYSRPHPQSRLDAETTGKIRKELAACLPPMMQQLSGPYREALTLVEIDGMTQQKAAKQLGLSLSGMKSRVQRGRRELKMMIEDCCRIELDQRRAIMNYEVQEKGCKPCSQSPN